MIKLKTIRWMNFLSTGNEFIEIDLTVAKTTLFIGTNGDGKSTMIDALSFVLFNKPFRKITRPQMVNSITNKELLVECEFTTAAHSYVVRRGVKPNVFEVWRDGVLVEPPADLREHQDWLEAHVLHMNHRAFTQIVVLSNDGYTPFMKLPAQARREVIEELLDIGVFSTMNTLLKEKVDANKSARIENDADLAQVDVALEMNRRHVESLRVDNEKTIREIEAKADAVSLEMDEMRKVAESKHEQASLLRDKLKHEPELVAAERDSRAAMDRAQWKYQGLKKEMDFLQHSSECPACKQGLDPVFKDTRIMALRIEMSAAETEGISAGGRTHDLYCQIEDMKHWRNEMRGIESEIAKIVAIALEKSRFIEQTKIEIAKLRKRSEVISTGDDITVELTAKRDAVMATRARVLAETEVLSAAASLLKDGGVKARVVRQYIPVLNSLVAKYLAALDFFVDFRLDENFNETIKSRYRDEFTYESFSAGQKCRINLALLFAWRAVARLRNSVHCDLLVLDEILDGSLDAVGAEDFIKILGTLTENEHVFVISHRGDQLIDKFDRALEF